MLFTLNRYALQLNMLTSNLCRWNIQQIADATKSSGLMEVNAVDGVRHTVQHEYRARNLVAGTHSGSQIQVLIMGPAGGLNTSGPL